MTIPDLDKRIEAAMSKMDMDCNAEASTVRGILMHAFPEFFADPPTHWIAPWEPTNAMVRAYNNAPPDQRDWDAVVDWQHMRDAYLTNQTEGG